MLELHVCTQREIARFYPLFELDFDKKELPPRIAVHRAALRGDAELLSLRDSETGSDLGFALVGCRGVYGYVWLKAFCVAPFLRGQGLGVELMRLLNRRYADRQGLVAELTAFGERAENSAQYKLRRFFRRFGYEEQPLAVTVGGAPASVFVKPLRGSAELGASLRRVLLDFYGRFYSPAGIDETLGFPQES
ncbi:MAG: GNAT family N-acetyltransferase [Oscillospiraceae bacterium]|nr:GNAT family N-acetyltransferase [Oscillospiraceae bacterium]